MLPQFQSYERLGPGCCTVDWYGRYPIIYRVSYRSGGCLGFLQSPVSQSKIFICTDLGNMQINIKSVFRQLGRCCQSEVFICYICSGQIIATSHDRFPPNWWFGKVGEILFHLARSFPLKEAYTYTVDGSELLHQLGRSEPYIYIWLVSFSIPQGHPFPQFFPLCRKTVQVPVRTLTSEAVAAKNLRRCPKSFPK